ncbi:MAG: hypothetical protein Q9203_001686 [Teloschistes exilis]
MPDVIFVIFSSSVGVTKTVTETPQYLFPSAFRAVLNAQLPDGSWYAQLDSNDTEDVDAAESNASQNLSDSILSTMAALYTLNTHSAAPHQIQPSSLPDPSLTIRTTRAASALGTMLGRWRVDDCNAVGFEVLIPALLDALGKQGFAFDFPGKARLFETRAAKIQRIQLFLSEGKAPMALLHSLEAFHDWKHEAFDARKVKDRLVHGSVMASPAATASYLMNASIWDDEAEAYLRMVLECGSGKGSGGVPSAWPSSNFEIPWVRGKRDFPLETTTKRTTQTTSTLLESGLWTRDDEGTHQNLVCKTIEESRKLTGGLLGFDIQLSKATDSGRSNRLLGTGTEPDLVDSAKESIVLSLSGRLGLSQKIITRFDGPKCLKTYQAERDPHQRQLHRAAEYSP